ncbi:transposase [Streptomyces rapamycinicus]|uniref:transposase n=1 Tax=Streptomyces rapamycinicus TaxID=1226757 RepID=UPI001FAA1533|nr:transposase [Streptomyces rapamycinicus]UTP37465.1 transposase [Streptomyces rapamycinicus NRRL 5491]
MVADTGYGANADFRQGLEDRGLAYVLQAKGEMTAHAEGCEPHQPCACRECRPPWSDACTRAGGGLFVSTSLGSTARTESGSTT